MVCFICTSQLYDTLWGPFPTWEWMIVSQEMLWCLDLDVWLFVCLFIICWSQELGQLHSREQIDFCQWKSSCAVLMVITCGRESLKDRTDSHPKGAAGVHERILLTQPQKKWNWHGAKGLKQERLFYCLLPRRIASQLLAPGSCQVLKGSMGLHSRTALVGCALKSQVRLLLPPLLVDVRSLFNNEYEIKNVNTGAILCVQLS